MKLRIKTTFDFGKLASKLPKILEKHTQRTARSSATGAREAIERGVRPALDPGGETLKRRKYKVKVATGGHSKGGGTKPLFHTGTLFRSIKGTSEGLEMWDYGLFQHEGRGHFPPRPFIQPSKKAILKSFDAFRKEIRKALKK